MYITTKTYDLTISKILIDSKDCLTNVSLNESLTEVNISSCLNSVSTSTPLITLISDDFITKESVYLEDIQVSVGSPMSTSLSCITDNDGDGQILLTCALYLMTDTTYEGDLDVNDNNSTIQVDMSCIFNNDKSGCLSNYVIDGCGSETVLDLGTGLCWDWNFNRDGTKNWEDAKSYCTGLTTHPSGHTDWYLSTRQEFETIVDLTRTAPHIVGGNTIFSSVVSNYYWTKTTYGTSTTYAFYVYLLDGISDGLGKGGYNYVACLRRH
ncbi:MAG: DUF1566 domain-containing protein [Candidatus Woesearchaeota archaeon]|nr:DUF1566 domain-containing protein [Candidatus Woesearchaeota archaeon]